jgi:hypothetical protein
MKQINRTFIIAGGLALSGVIVAGLAIAGQSGHFGHRKHIQSFQALSLDKNGDGLLTRDEMLAKNKQRFSKLDADGDGTISQNEFSARLAALFDRLDVNADGMLSTDEMPRRIKRHHGGGHHGQRGSGYGAEHRHDANWQRGHSVTPIDAGPPNTMPARSSILVPTQLPS